MTASPFAPLFFDPDDQLPAADEPNPGEPNISPNGPIVANQEDAVSAQPAAETDAATAITVDVETCQALGDDLQRQGRAKEAETFYRAALAMTPEHADIWSHLGLALLMDQRAEEAVLCEREALRLEPDNVEALNNLGIAMHGIAALSEAQNHFHAVLRLRPDHGNATLNLGVIRQSLGHLAEAEQLYRRARDLGTDNARVNNNLALALAELGRLDEAEETCRQALAANPNYPEAETNLGMIQLMQGNMGEGWWHYEQRWKIPPLATLPRLPDDQRWRGGETIEGKTILLLAEQGFGDVIQFCRYAPMLKQMGAQVILAVPNELERLLGSLRGVDRLVARDDQLPEFDLHCPLMSLPLAFRTTEATIPWRVPYLAAEPEAIERWEEAMRCAPPGRRIGLVWAGAHRRDQPHAAAIDRRRSMKLADMAPLADVADCVFVSLQLGPAAKQIETAPFPVLDVGHRLDDFAETAALIDTLDLVISVDTAAAHLAGALGKPVWLLNRHDACWRWMRDRDDTPWYPTMRLFRQTEPGDWSGLMRRVAEALPGFQTYG
jgi:Flp pilus assembly protein TadD